MKWSARMFDEMPSRRITERRKELLSALYAALCVVGGYADAGGHFKWSLIAWAFLFVASLRSYWKARHADPWNPPIESIEPPPINEFEDVRQELSF
jgi:hypothetical protein